MIYKTLRKITVCLCLVTVPASAQAIKFDERVWEELGPYNECKDRHIVNVAQTIESMEEGLALLREVLCPQYLEVVNEIARLYKDNNIAYKRANFFAKKIVSDMDRRELYQEKLRLVRDRDNKRPKKTTVGPDFVFPLKFYW